MSDGYDAEDYAAVVLALVEARPPILRELSLIGGEKGGCEDVADVGDIGELWTALTSLERVSLRGMSMTLGHVDAPQLRSFEIQTMNLGDVLTSLGRARCPELQTLVFSYSSYMTPVINVDDLRPLLATTKLPKLAHLELAGIPFDDGIWLALARSPLLLGLQTLTLPSIALSFTGAKILRDHAVAFSQLKRLDLRANAISSQTRALVEGLFPEVLLDAST